MSKIQVADLQFVNELADDELAGGINISKEKTSLIMGGASLTPGQAATCTVFGGVVAIGSGPLAPLAGALAAAGCILILGSDSPSPGNISDIIAA
jgi:hypothetical protein